MTPLGLLLLLIGICYVSELLVRLIVWLDGAEGDNGNGQLLFPPIRSILRGRKATGGKQDGLYTH